MAIACLILLGGFFAPAPPVELPGSATVTADGELDELVLRLRNPKLSLDERVAIEERLLALGESGARALQRSVEDRSRRVDERAKRTEKVYLAGFERAAKRAMTVRIDRAAQAEIEELQKQLGNLRGDDALSKERIHAEGDPARERLAQLLQTRISPVLDREPELAAARQSLLDDVYELEQEFALWRRCNQVISEPRRSKAFIDPTPRRPDVEKAEDWICVLALPMSDSDREVLLKNRAIAAELADPEEGAGVLDLNRLRLLLGLHPLLLDVKLCDAARDHSNDMRTLGFFAHESPLEGKRTPWDRAARCGTSASAENISGGQGTGAGANLSWWYSPGHHRNLFGGHARIGLGRSEQIWTQMFG